MLASECVFVCVYVCFTFVFGGEIGHVEIYSNLLIVHKCVCRKHVFKNGFILGEGRFTLLCMSHFN